MAKAHFQKSRTYCTRNIVSDDDLRKYQHPNCSIELLIFLNNLSTVAYQGIAYKTKSCSD